MQESRLFKIVYHLLEKGQATAPELAEKFEVSVRTIYRDIDALSGAGIPIYAEAGRNGGIHLMNGFVLDKAVLSEEEKQEILTALQSINTTQNISSSQTLQKLSAIFNLSSENWLEVNFSRWGNKGLGCTRHSIPEEELKHLILAGLQQHLALFLNKSYVLSQIEEMEIKFGEAELFSREIQRLHKEQEKFMSLRTSLYEDFKQGIITGEDFKDFRKIYEIQYQAAEDAIRQQEDTIQNLFKAGITAGANLEKMKAKIEITELDRNILVTFVSRVLVYEDKRVFLELRAKDMFADILVLADYLDCNVECQGGKVQS